MHLPLAKNLGSIAIASAEFGTYSELEVNGTKTSDIVKVFRYLGDLEELARNLDSLTFQLFLSATAEINVNLGELFPLPGNFILTFFEGALSSMLDIQVQTPERRNERRHWYIGQAGQTCNQVCNTYHLHCTENSINEQSSLIYSGVAREAFHEAGVTCPASRDGIPGPANLSPEGCYKFTTGGNRPTCDVIESISQKSLCYCEYGRTGAIALMESTEVNIHGCCRICKQNQRISNFFVAFHFTFTTNNVAECVHDDQTWMQDTYIALSVSAHISTGYLDQLLSPLATFGEFLSGLIPGSNVTNGTAPNPVNDVEGLMLAARTYLKIREFVIVVV